MLLRFPFDDVEKEARQLFVGRAGAHDFHDVELQITAEAGPQFSVAGEAEFVAALAEMQVRHRADKSEALLPPGDFVVGRRPVGAESGLGNERAEVAFELSARFSDGQEIAVIENVAVADGHQLDEAEDEIALGGEFRERD